MPLPTLPYAPTRRKRPRARQADAPLKAGRSAADAPTMLRVMRRSALLAAVTCAVVAVVGFVSLADPGHQEPAGDEGHVRVVERLDSRFDRYTSRATPAVRTWVQQRLWRAVVYSPYFDDKTSWYASGWAYQDLYGIEVGSDLAREHPSWILRDARGRRLYLQYGCTGGRCPQYAGDVTNPAFRRHWIATAQRVLKQRYAGLWIDDVNLELRVSDGRGRTVRPVVRGRALSDAAWRAAIAGFTTQVRQALPRAEIVHNSIWFAGGERRQDDPSVRKQIRSADIINLERGVNDEGLTGDDGVWSVQALLRFVDDVHALGASVIFEGVDPSARGRAYNLAAQLLAANGHDAVGVTDLPPGSALAHGDLDLGSAQGPREADGRVLRRAFTSGLVLLNPPGAPTRTVALDGDYVNLAGRDVESVTLSAGQGAVLRRR